MGAAKARPTQPKRESTFEFSSERSDLTGVVVHFKGFCLTSRRPLLIHVDIIYDG